MNLIIVESPTKAKTIEKFLKGNFLVASSYGHIRDLPEKKLGIDLENNFQPHYEIPSKAKKTIQTLKTESKKCKEIILATDEDREGESIAFHLKEILKLKNPKRIVFHEITKTAIEEALKNPRHINMNLVNAQQARRILDRLVGYKLSPFLWKKIIRGLSAGRVQSVAVRLIVEREKEIKEFKPEEYWSIEAKLRQISDIEKEFTALLIKKDGKVISKLEIKNKEETDKILKDLQKAEYKVINLEKKEVKKNPLPPFITSSLQQEAWQKFRWPAKMTMAIAQKLYEKGVITYHRTDSLNLSEISEAAAKKFILENFGKEYWPGFSRNYRTKAKAAQEAHEAIRPSYAEKKIDDLKGLDERQAKLYNLIWQRFIASQMTEAHFNSWQVDISAKNYIFRTKGQTLKFDGFLKVYPLNFKEAELPPLKKNDKLELLKLLPAQHFTQPPARYNEASLIKVLEKEGIGRPSTYAPILETVQKRNYVLKDEKKQFQPTEIGIMVNDLLVEHFPKIVDIKFTAKMENDLDKIANGKENWLKTMREFYKPFEKNLEKKQKEVAKKDITEKTGRKCPKCGSEILIRWGKFGKFYACSNFPRCKYTESLEKPKLEIKCPKCKNGEITEKRTKKGKIFYGCDQFPKCDFALWDKPTGEKCPECGSLLVEKGKQIICSNKDCQFKKSE